MIPLRRALEIACEPNTIWFLLCQISISLGKVKSHAIDSRISTIKLIPLIIGLGMLCLCWNNFRKMLLFRITTHTHIQSNDTSIDCINWIQYLKYVKQKDGKSNTYHTET